MVDVLDSRESRFALAFGDPDYGLYHLDPGRPPLADLLAHLPFNCRSCECRIERLRDLVRIDCVCRDPYYHYLCLPPSALHHCQACSRKSLPLRGARAIWDRYTYAEWKTYLNPEDEDQTREGGDEDGEDHWQEEMRWEVRRSLLKDWPHGFSNLPKIVAMGQLVFCFWDPRVQARIPETWPDLGSLADRLEEVLHLWPFEDIDLVAPQKERGSDSSTSGKGFLAPLHRGPATHAEFLTSLKVWSAGIIDFTANIIDNGHIDTSNGEGANRSSGEASDGLYFEGPLLWRVLFPGLPVLRSITGKPDLIIHALGISESQLLERVARVIKMCQQSERRTCRWETLTPRSGEGMTRVRLHIQGWDQRVELWIHLIKDMRQLLVSEDSFGLPWQRGLMANQQGIWVNMHWLDCLRLRTVPVVTLPTLQTAGSNNDNAPDTRLSEIFSMGFIAEICRNHSTSSQSKAQELAGPWNAGNALDLLNLGDTLHDLVSGKTSQCIVNEANKTEQRVVSQPFFSWATPERRYSSYGHRPGYSFLKEAIGKICRKHAHGTFSGGNPYLPPRQRH